ncbi:NO-inducible flavohemoprotein [Myroides sp. DF42-4-2]|uniref:NO-inducible flavohemoprotein n=1 Tax=unclassified Myroides TaxID=2642485 RepID=UPI0025771293|nr:NO-inducible flavohemoprotein [Myroides sp. DF42-4-2]MDM1408887.1 NO-inducible flavohemoprotein [Myroides sp. DF42-4-2]
MTTEQKELVKSTVPILRAHGVVLTKHFYQRMFAHNPELKHVFNMGNQQNEKQQTALAMAVLAYAEHIENPSVLLPVVNSIGHKHTSLDIRTEHYAIVGKHLIASIKEVLGELATDDLLGAWAVAYQELADLMSGHEQNIYNQKVAEKGGWTGWRPFVVKEKVVESSEITSFYLYPADQGPIADFKPGQYLSLRLFLPELNLLQPRQYSISCAPNGTYYRISVKKEVGSQHPDGLISNRLHQVVQVGDLVDVSSPSGVFVLQENQVKTKVFISGGVGQTPLLSMLESIIEQEKETAVKWIHGCRGVEVHAFKQRVEELATVSPKLKQHIFYDNPAESTTATYKGWVELAQIEDDILSQEAEYYICGPRGFIEKHYQYLVEQKVDKTAIFFEEFGPTSLTL